MVCINIQIYKLCFIYLNYILLLKKYIIFFKKKKIKNYLIQKIYKRYKKILKTIYSSNATIIATIRTEYGFEITTQNQSIQVPEVEASVTFDNCN